MVNANMELNNIYNIDCLEGLRQLEDNSIDLVVTSPPYDDLREYNGFSFDFENIGKELYRTLKEGGVIVWVVGDSVVNGSETLNSFRQAIKFQELGFNIHDTMIYAKNGFTFPEKSRYPQTFEYMFVISKGKPKTVNLIRDKPNKWKKPWGKTGGRKKNGEIYRKCEYSGGDYGLRYNVWYFNTGMKFSTKDMEAYNHPAIFPESLARDHILTWSNENDLIVDIFNGSGTTTKMAKDYNRNYIGFELSKEYCDIAEKRLSKVNNKKLNEWF